MGSCWGNQQRGVAFQTIEVPARDQRSYQVKLYQKVNGTNFVHLPTVPETYNDPSKQQDIPFEINDDYFKPGPKIMKAKVFYPDSHVLVTGLVVVSN